MIPAMIPAGLKNTRAAAHGENDGQSDFCVRGSW